MSYHETELNRTLTRPLGLTERYFLQMGGKRGCADPYIILTLDGANTLPITDDQVVFSWAVMRLRHPLLAARISYTDIGTNFIYNRPPTDTHAIRRAKAQVEFHELVDRDVSIRTVQNRWGGTDLAESLDIRTELSAITWFRNSDNSRGQYVLALHASHTISDAYGMLGIARQFLELLTAQSRAQSEMHQYFYEPISVPLLPLSLENIIPDPSDSDVEEQMKAREAYNNLMQSSSNPMSGIIPDGPPTEEKAVNRIVRHTWNKSDTLKIVQSCKAQGVTITQFCTAALILAAMQYGEPIPEEQDVHYFKVHLPMDALSRITSGSEPFEAALRVGHYPEFLRVPRTAASPQEQGPAIWPLAKQIQQRHADFFHSPYFWSFIRYYLLDSQESMTRAEVLAAQTDSSSLDALRTPFLPLLSSMGDWSKRLPSHFVVAPPMKNSSTGTSLSNGFHGGAIHVADVSLNLKVIPAVPCLHLWTFDGKMNLQLTHNVTHTSIALIDPFFKTFVDIITLLGVQAGP